MFASGHPRLERKTLETVLYTGLYGKGAKHNHLQRMHAQDM